MNSSNLQYVGKLSEKRGAKVLLYGPPGSGKTPMAMALPKAVACITEPGLRSARSNMHTLGYYCYNFKEIENFFDWFCNPNSKDVYQFQTLIIDSITALADIVLSKEERSTRDGRQAYGKMAKYVMGIVDYLQNMPNMNVVLIAQMGEEERLVPGSIPGTTEPRIVNFPLFPGKQLEKKIPHTFDEILYAHKCKRPDGSFGPAIATTELGGNFQARSRCGNLNQLEPPDLNYIFSKINQ